MGKDWFCSLHKKLFCKTNGLSKGAWTTQRGCSTQRLTVAIVAHVDRATTATSQVAQLLSSEKAFSASGQWNHCESRIGNAGVTLRAQKEQLQLNETARTKAANKKSEEQLKTLELHRQP